MKTIEAFLQASLHINRWIWVTFFLLNGVDRLDHYGIAPGFVASMILFGFASVAAPWFLRLEFVDAQTRLRFSVHWGRRSSSKQVAPPLNGAFLLYLFYDSKKCNTLVGDLEERYRFIRKKFGARRANFWYWTQVIRSVGPIAWAATKTMLKAVSGVAALVEMWRRIRS
jgi:hypothetical protein